MLYNYSSETDLKGFFPELSRYLWSGETNYNKQKQTAEQIVGADFSNRGYKNVYLRPDLYLRNTTDVLTSASIGVAFQDTINRFRLGYNVISYTGACTLVFQGSNDNATWTTIDTVTISATGIGSIVFTTGYKYYRVNSTVTTNLAFKAWLTETNYDLFFQYKWLELIMWNASKEPEDIYEQKALRLKQWYEDLFANGIIYEDPDLDGVVNSDDKQSAGTVRFGR